MFPSGTRPKRRVDNPTHAERRELVPLTGHTDVWWRQRYKQAVWRHLW